MEQQRNTSGADVCASKKSVKCWCLWPAERREKKKEGRKEGREKKKEEEEKKEKERKEKRMLLRRAMVPHTRRRRLKYGHGSPGQRKARRYSPKFSLL